MKESATVANNTTSAGQKSAGWSSLGWAACTKIAVIGLLFWYFFRTEIYEIVSKWDNPTWSHGMLIPVFSLYFLNQRKKEILSLDARPSWLGFFVAASLLLIAYPLNMIQFGFGYLQSVIMIGALGAVVLFVGGWRLIRYTWLPILYLIFAVPLPERLLRQLTIPMRIFSAQIATYVLNFIPHLQATSQGVVIDIVYKGVTKEPSLDVAEACSGFRLLLTFFALGVAMAYLHRRPLLHRLVLLVSTVPISIICNVLRVTITAMIYILWDTKYAQGIWHDMLGLFMLLPAYGLYGALAWFMSNLFVEEKQQVSDVIYSRRAQGQAEMSGKQV